MIKVEACISGETVEQSLANALAANEGGATTIELCRSMAYDGLTPMAECVEAARSVFERPGLMTMIRPRAGGFRYNSGELESMAKQIERAAQAGADGVVFGTLTEIGQLDESAARSLTSLAKSLGLATTFHRAFDALPDSIAAIEALIGIGVDRILTSGIAWGATGNALDGAAALNEAIQAAAGRIEIVIAGSVSPSLAPQVLNRLSPWRGDIAVHSYSGVQYKGKTSAAEVRALVDSVSGW